MGLNSIRCPVLDAPVTQVTDLEGNVIRIVCVEYQSDGSCRLKKAAQDGGPLSQLLQRTAEDSLSSRSTMCVLRTA